MIQRFLVRRFWNAGTLSVLLIILALFFFATGIASSLKNTDTRSFFLICLAAAAISYGLGKTRSNGIPASAGIAALGLLFVWILGARLTQPLLNLLKVVLSTIPKIITSIQLKIPVDTTSIVEAWLVIVRSSSALSIRLRAWFSGFGSNITLSDTLIRNMVWALILWLCAAWTGWFTVKRNAVVSLLPLIAVLAAVTSYSERRIDSLWFVVMIMLVLMGIWNYSNHILQWTRNQIDYSDSIRMDSGVAIIFLSLAIGAIAYITPSVSWQDIIDYVHERQAKNETAEMLGIRQPVGTGQTHAEQIPALPREHLLSEGVENSERIVMIIRTGELPPITDPSRYVTVPRYYWRSTVYDQYVGTGWVTSTVVKQNISPNTPLIPGLLDGYHLVHMNVQMIEPEGRLFWSGMLFSADVPFSVNWRVKPTSDLFAEQPALLQSDMFAASTTADTYQVDTYIPVPNLDALHAASTDYPEAIRLRYFTLPSSVPERVIDLAHKITSGITNPYDKAKAIETYLRKNFSYTLDVPTPPEDRDVADYFLFDLKKGYCDYYATAMVVLARASGLPARFVSGYSPGSYDSSNAQYIIRELNAHSWVEVYFPEIGWVEFEPTASQPEIDRAVGVMPVPAEQNGEIASKLLIRFRLERILLWTSPILLLLIGAILYFTFLERWFVFRLSPEEAIDHIYQRFYHAGRPLAGEWTYAETTYEFMNKFRSTMQSVEQHTRHKALMETATDNAATLTNLYNASLFINRKTNKHDAVFAWKTWTQLRSQLFNIKIVLKLTRHTNNDRA